MLNRKSIVAFILVLCAIMAAFAGYTRWDWNTDNGGAWYATWVPSSYYGGEIYFNNGNLVYNGLFACNNCNEP
jgi:hypothetical protein